MGILVKLVSPNLKAGLSPTGKRLVVKIFFQLTLNQSKIQKNFLTCSVLEAWLITRTLRNPRGWVLSSVRRRNLNRNQIQRRRRKISGHFEYLKFSFNNV